MITEFNVLHINTYDVGGGAEKFSFDLITYFDNSTLVVNNKRSTNKKVYQLPSSLLDILFIKVNLYLNKLGIKIKLKSDLFLNEKFNYTINKLKKIDAYKEAKIIHIHNLHGGYFDLKALKHISKDKFIVWTLHDMWAITGGEAHTFEDLGYITGNARTPYIHNYPLCNPIIDGRQRQLNTKRKIYNMISSKIVFVPVSSWLERKIKESYVFNNKIKLSVIKNGVDINHYSNLKKRNWTVPRVLFFNTDNPFKGSELLISLLPEFNIEFEIFCVGKVLMTENKFITINNFGFVNDSNKIHELFNNVDILVFTSKAENFPLTILEAMSSGVSVVASDVGGIKEIISDNQVGRTFVNGNSFDFYNILCEQLENIDLSRTIGNNASLHIQNKFSFSNMATEYLELYKKILSNN